MSGEGEIREGKIQMTPQGEGDFNIRSKIELLEAVQFKARSIRGKWREFSTPDPEGVIGIFEVPVNVGGAEAQLNFMLRRKRDNRGQTFNVAEKPLFSITPDLLIQMGNDPNLINELLNAAKQFTDPNALFRLDAKVESKENEAVLSFTEVTLKGGPDLIQKITTIMEEFKRRTESPKK